MKKLMTITAILAAMAVPGAYAGAVGGEKFKDTVVRTNGRDIFNVAFRAGESAVVRVNGDGDSDLDLYIYDENNNLIAKDDDGLDYCIVRFTPKWTGTFQIVVRNRGVANRYLIQTN